MNANLKIMSGRCAWVTALFLASCPGARAGGEDWNRDLFLGNGDYWRLRIPVVMSNGTAADAMGTPVDIRVGTGDGEADLEGLAADSLRVCNAEGVEFLWALSDPSGQPLRRGPIPSGSTLSLPAECRARSESRCFVYADNPSAWPLPDFLESRGGFRNGGVESGTGDTPDGWDHDEADSAHRASWVSEDPHGGSKCLKTVVADGAEETWISTRQSRIPIQGGARYVMRAWVRADGVKGWAGWYIHVGNATNFMMLGPMLNGGGGTYGWKELRAEFTAPPSADRADLGTVLRGTGTAWFDDVSLECLDRPSLSARALKPERLPEIREAGADAPWPAQLKGAEWTHRVPIRVTNLGGAGEIDGLVAADLGGLFARLGAKRASDSVRVFDGARTVDSFVIGSTVFFEGRIAGRERRTFHAYLRGGGTNPDGGGTAKAEYAANPALPGGETRSGTSPASIGDYTRLLNHPRNLVKNPDFEAGAPFPDSWSGGVSEANPDGVRMGLDEPGLFGRRCAKMEVPASREKNWRGWRQDVPVKPGRTYFLAGWMRCRDLDGGLQLHAHCRKADGTLCAMSPMTSAGPAIRGTANWTLISGAFAMPADIATFQLHLTMDARGAAWHDGIALVEIAGARPGSPEPRPAVAGATVAAWPVDAIVKVFREDGPPAAVPAARITAARNDREPLQIAVRSPCDVANVRVVVDAPRSASGAALTNLSVGVVGYVPVDHPTSYYQSETPAWHLKRPLHAGRSDGWAGWWPDPILPRATFDLEAGRTQPVWITVAVPGDAPAGDYAGRVRFESAGATLADVPFTVRVWDFTVPEERHLKAIYDCRLNGKLWQIPGKTADQARREFWRFMAERRLCPDTVKPEPSIRYRNGAVEADFKAFDDAASFYFGELKMPHLYTPWMFYGFGWGHPPSTRFGEKPYEGEAPFEGADRTKLRPEFKRAYQACLKVFWDHLREKGWDRTCVLYISDEPFDHQAPIREQMKALCDMIHEVDRAIPVYCSTWHHQPEWDGYLDVWGIGHYGVVPVETIGHIRKTGARIWWTTDGQMCTDTPFCAVERLLPHYCFKYGAEAYEFWGIDWLTYNPYEVGWHRFIHQSSEPGKSYYVRYPNGDGFLAYPGGPVGHAGPVTSVRLEQAREGCEDYEYLWLLRERIAAARAGGRDVSAAERTMSEAQSLVDIPNAGGLRSTETLPDPGRVQRVKESVARAIEGLAR